VLEFLKQWIDAFVEHHTNIFVPLKGTPTWHFHIHVQTGFCWQPVKLTGYFTWTWKLPPPPPPPAPQKRKNQNLMMSTFCSNTLIFAPECWKCTLRGPDFNIFPEGIPLDGSSLGTHAFNSMHASPRERFFQFSAYSKAFATFLKSYRKPCTKL